MEDTFKNGIIFQGDCLEIMDKLIENGVKVDCFVTDPPYKLIQGGCTNHAVKLKGANLDDLKNGSIFSNNTIKFSEWLPKVYSILKENSHCYIMCNDRNLQELLNESIKVGFRLLNILTWKKSKHSPNRYYLKNAEFIVFLRKGKAKNINNMGTKQVLEVDNVDNKLHPSEKPIDLLKILIENSSQKSEIILDCFMGSGSTCIACQNTNRNFIGIELDEKYYKIARDRIKQLREVE